MLNKEEILKLWNNKYTFKPGHGAYTLFNKVNPEIEYTINFNINDDVGLQIKPFEIPKEIEGLVLLLNENIALLNKTDIFYENSNLNSNLIEKILKYEIDEVNSKIGYYKELTNYDSFEERFEEIKPNLKKLITR